MESSSKPVADLAFGGQGKSSPSRVTIVAGWGPKRPGLKGERVSRGVKDYGELADWGLWIVDGCGRWLSE